MVQGTVAIAALITRETVHSRGSSGCRRRWPSWLPAVITSIGSTMIKISAPISRTFCGTRAREELQTTSSKMARVSTARVDRNLAPLRIRSRLMDTATNSRPVSAAAAAMIVLKNGSQAARS